MTGKELPLREVMLLMAEVAETSTGPDVTIAGTAARLVEEHGLAAEEAEQRAREAFEKWVEAYEGGFS